MIGYVGALQGQKKWSRGTRTSSSLRRSRVSSRCLFLEMGMTTSHKYRNLKFAGRGFIFFGLLAPNLFATLGILIAHMYTYLTNPYFQPGASVLFTVLCGAASYISVPAVHKPASQGQPNPHFRHITRFDVSLPGTTVKIQLYLRITPPVRYSLFPLAA